MKLRKCEPDLIQSSNSGFEIGEIGFGSGSHWRWKILERKEDANVCVERREREVGDE